MEAKKSRIYCIWDHHIFNVRIWFTFFFDAIWSFPANRAVPLMVVALVLDRHLCHTKTWLSQIRYLKHGINVTRGKYDNLMMRAILNHF